MPFGRAMLKEWCLDPEVTYLNHGTVGATPRRVIDAQDRIRGEIERQPSEYLLRKLVNYVGPPDRRPGLIREAAARVAPFLGARGEDLVFVENITVGANAVLRSFPLAEGDEILVTDHAYGAVANAALFAARERGARVVTVDLPWPPSEEGILDAVARGITPRTRLAVVDHVTSLTALVFPVARIVALCRKKGVAVLVDGAHAPGAIPLDIPALGADWYTGNLHKWAWAPRSCGFLWAAPERQAGLHPPAVSWGLDKGFVHEFDWTGTRDPSPSLAAPAAIDLLREWGEEEVRSYNHRLAREAVRLLARRWGTEPVVPEGMLATMAVVPLPGTLVATAEAAVELRHALLASDRIESQIHFWKGRLWTRVSAQIYNDMDDVERLADAVLRRA